ncbi:hypothetical protein Y032_0004g2215 [Ancylostoma ceylanicum]|uniref:Uncharacterized protein n=1 Tax=Ancylostoma ceylanicum TaxID=53326 RepID=A0A016VW97_9BILA|nr:hypothetical protein Y032_0004g2215 [Ancylostoma ceylanicum]
MSFFGVELSTAVINKLYLVLQEAFSFAALQCTALKTMERPPLKDTLFVTVFEEFSLDSDFLHRLLDNNIDNAVNNNFNLHSICGAGFMSINIALGVLVHLPKFLRDVVQSRPILLGT